MYGFGVLSGGPLLLRKLLATPHWYFLTNGAITVVYYFKTTSQKYVYFFYNYIVGDVGDDHCPLEQRSLLSRIRLDSSLCASM